MGAVGVCCANETVEQVGQLELKNISNLPSPRQDCGTLKSPKGTRETQTIFTEKEGPLTDRKLRD